MPTLDQMTSLEIKEHYRRLILYLLKTYPNAADETSDDHMNFVDDVTDLLLARTKN